VKAAPDILILLAGVAIYGQLISQPRQSLSWGSPVPRGPLTSEEGLRVPVRLTGAHNVSNAVNSFWQAVLSWAQFCCNAVELLN
jgi:hypothetical protein